MPTLDLTAGYIPYVDDVSMVTDANRAALRASDAYPSNEHV